MTSSSYELSVIAKLSNLSRSIERLERSIEAEEEVHRRTVHYSDDKGYVYYSAQLDTIPNRKEKEINELTRKADTYRSKREVAIEHQKVEIQRLQKEIERHEAGIQRIQKEIETNDTTLETMIDAANKKYDGQVADYTASINRIVESKSTPTGKVYLKAKEQLILDRKARDTLMVESDVILSAEREKKRERAIQQIRAEKAAADKLEAQERLAAFELLSKERIAREQAKAARWKAHEENPETYVDPLA